ncbi:MAG TPA: hypothetical protein VFE53_22760 [Mucilaginibacter sp.]|jgi:hypothetical protein|nr:hypothetical protein [Mucilaginibacter sp.]
MGKRFEELIYATLLLLIFSASASAQPYRRLTPADFRGAARPGNFAEVAETSCTIEYAYTARRENDYYVLSFNIRLIMNNDQSWMDRSRVNTPALMAEILKHEQGHYNISYLEQQELLRTVSRTVFRDNYKQEANAIFERVDAKYRQLNLDYDNDTQNSMNKVQQHSWDAYFARALSSVLGKDNYYAVANEGSTTLEDNR